MAHLGTGVEYALHCLLWLVDPDRGTPSSRDLAEMQGVSPTFLAKIFPKLEKAGLVQAVAGVRGGYRLARAPSAISVLDVVDAVEGSKPLFDCQEVRGRCAMFEGAPPRWATTGVCGIHAVMLRAEKSMRAELQRSSLADLAVGVHSKTPPPFTAEIKVWFEGRVNQRLGAKTRVSETKSLARRDKARKKG
jgi:Rrf2 family protein